MPRVASSSRPCRRIAIEAILVDDGSTDGSGARVEALAARHPGTGDGASDRRPAAGRLGHATSGSTTPRGRYIQFLDSDDTLAASCLERQLEVADSSAADVVVGKLASDFRGVWHPLFRRTVTGKTLADYPLIRT